MRWRLRWQLRLVVAAFVAFASSLPAQAQAPVQKILCLHGGGMNGPEFRRNPGIAAIMAELPGYEYVFPTAPYGSGGGNIWIRDPPGGKGSATTDPGFADDALALLDDVVASEGPFYGILGYSQGSAFVPIYIAHAPLGTFKVAFMFCGYLTTTHLGLLDTVNAASPFGGIPALVWMGNNDWIITNPHSVDQASKFTEPTVIASSGGGHTPPTSDDDTFVHVIEFMEVTTRDGTGGGGGLTIGSPRGVAAWVFIGWLVYMAFAHPITGCVYLCCYKKPPTQGKEVDCPKAAGYIIGGTSICCAPCICIMLCQGCKPIFKQTSEPPQLPQAPAPVPAMGPPATPVAAGEVTVVKPGPP